MSSAYEIYTRQVTEAYAPLNNDAARENELLERIQFADMYAEEAIEEGSEFDTVTADGHAAFLELTEAYLPLVMSIARHYSLKNEDFMDLVQDGNERLLQLAKSHSPGDEMSFSAKLNFELKRCMVESITKDNVVKPSTYIARNIGRVLRASETYAQEHDGQIGTPEDIAAIFGPQSQVTPSMVRAIVKYIQNQKQHVEFEPDLNHSQEVDSYARYAQIIDRDSIVRAFEEVGLTKRQRTVLALAYGLDGGADLTQKEIGILYNRTKSAMHTETKNAFAKLRTSQGLAEAYGSITVPVRRENPLVADDILSFRQWIYDNFHLLDERYQLMVSMRYGLGEDRTTYKLKDIGTEIGIGVPTISHHLKRAIDSLRTNPDATNFDEYVNS